MDYAATLTALSELRYNLTDDNDKALRDKVEVTIISVLDSIKNFTIQQNPDQVPQT